MSFGLMTGLPQNKLFFIGIELSANAKMLWLFLLIKMFLPPFPVPKIIIF